ncbi:MAG: hypothetical protein LBH40_00210, partial [Alphaproteobacteria bacterium]|nr:hypothetical protein [Alphaproteobacteria bacterium]
MNGDTRKTVVGAISLIFAILFFSGWLQDLWGGIFDFNKLAGTFPAWFQSHTNGTGAKGGFLFALTLVPSVMLALGMVAVFEKYGALFAATKLLNPILKPLMGISGSTAISLIASLQSTDAGASTAKILKDENKITDKELLIFAAFQFSAGAMVTNFLSSMAPLFVAIVDPTSGKGIPTS